MSREPSLDAIAAARSLRLDAVLDETARQLRSRSVEFIVLKGPTLRSRLYGPTESRPYADLDLLVGPSALPTALAALTDLGFVDITRSPVPLRSHDLVRDDDGAAIDLHFTLWGPSVSGEVVWALLRRRAEPARIGTEDILQLDDVAFALELALHAVHSHPEAEKPLEDLRRGAAQIPSHVWREAANLAAELGATEAFAAGLRRVPNGAVLADDIGLPIASMHTANRRAYLRLVAAQAGSYRFLRARLLPAPDTLRASSRLARAGKIGLALAYVSRPFGLAARAIAAGRLLRAGPRGDRT